MSDILPHISQSSPDEQFTVGINLIQKAFGAKQTQYNSELNQLRNYVKQKNDENNELKAQFNDLKRELKDRDEKIRLLDESLLKSRQEKDNLAEQIKRLNRELGKLQQFKKSIIASINEDDYVAVDNLTSSFVNASSSFSSGNTSTSVPRRNLTNVSAANSGSPLNTSLSSSSPNKSYSSTGNTSATYHNVQLLEGKQFFKKAKLELPYDSFNSFLSCIKRFNAKQATKDETLKTVRSIFGDEHEDLYVNFEMILDRSTGSELVH